MALNEIDGLKQIMPKIDGSTFERIIIVDGGSRDGTLEWATRNGYEIYVQNQRGLRRAYQEIWPSITSEYVIAFSPDGNCDPEKLSLLVENIVSFKPDLVNGSRYLPGVSSEDDDFITAFGNWLFNKTAKILFGGEVTDVMVIYRGFRANLPKELAILEDSVYEKYEKFLFTNISWEPIMAVRALHQGMHITEVPAGEPPRLYGKRKLQIVRW